MVSHIFNKIARTFAVLSLVAVPLLVSVNANAATDTTIQNGICSSTNSLQVNTGTTASGTCSSDATIGTTKINSFVKTVVNVFISIVGIISVIMIVYGGFRYITSGGDSTKIGNAKNTIIYALIGLVIVALAQFIVQYVLAKVTATT